MQIKLAYFKGTTPRVSPKLLDNEGSQLAVNCDLRFGDLRPLAGTAHVADIAKPGAHRSLFRLGGAWIAWPGEVDVVFAPVYNKDRRFLFTGDGEPKKSSSSLATTDHMTYPSMTYGLGVPAPAVPLNVEITPAESTAEYLSSTAYAYTYVTGWGEESAPSQETGVFELKEDQHCVVSRLDTPPSGYNITAWRIYRIAVGTKSAEFQFVAEVSTSNTAYTDTKKDSELGAAIETGGYTSPVTPWDANIYWGKGQRCVYGGVVYRCVKNVEQVPGSAPPDPIFWETSSSLTGLTALSNGVLSAFIENELYMTPPYIPYGWPLAYNLSTEYPIVALGHYNNTLIILTEGWPYLSDGQDPSSAGLTKVEFMQPCINKRGVVSGVNFTLYPSPDGLVTIGEEGVSVPSSGLLTKEQWNALGPEDFVSFWYDNRYVAFKAGTNQGYVLDTQASAPTLQVISLPAGVRVWGGHVDLEADGLFLLQDTGAGTPFTVSQFDVGSALTYTWRSKQFAIPSYTPVSVARIRADWGTGVTFTFYGDGVSLFTKLITDGSPFRLPAGMWRQVEFTLSGTDRVEEVILATSVEELAQ